MCRFIRETGCRVSAAVLLAACACLVLSATCANGAEAPAGAWSSSAALGTVLTRGNSETLAVNASLKAERKMDQDAVRLGVEANYGENEVTDAAGDKSTDKTVDNTKAFAEYKRTLSDRWYGVLNAEISRDKIADVKYRFVAGPSLGCYLLKGASQDLAIETGIVYIKDKVGGVTDDRVAFRFAQKYNWAISKTSKMWESVEYLPTADDFGQYLLNAEAGIEAAVNSRVGLRLVLQDRYNSEAPAGRDENDLMLVGGLTLKL